MPKYIDWSVIEPLIGTADDSVLAERFGISRMSVTSRRLMLGIPSYSTKGMKPFVFPDESIGMLGTTSDGRLAKRLRVSRAVVQKKRESLNIPAYGPDPSQRSPRNREWAEDELELLGTDSDRVIASIIGVSGGTVRNKRVSLGIAPNKQKREDIDWTPEVIALLGVVSDTEVAKKIGACRYSVLLKRKALGIPPYKQYVTGYTEERNGGVVHRGA